jgi:hypothetical protein
MWRQMVAFHDVGRGLCDKGDDRVVASHYRYIAAASVSEPLLLRPGVLLASLMRRAAVSRTRVLQAMGSASCTALQSPRVLRAAAAGLSYGMCVALHNAVQRR